MSLLGLIVRLAPTRRKYFNCSIVFRRKYRRLDEPPPLDGLQCVWAGPVEIENMDKHPEATSRGAYARRAARGDTCFCLKRGEELIAYQWVATGSACLYCGFGPRYELLFFPLRPDQVFMYDSYTYSAHRRQGYGTLLRERLHKTMERQGVREAYGLVAPENTPSISVTLKSEYEPLCMAYGIRIRNWSKMFFGPQPDVQLIQWTDEFKSRANNAAL
jgi:GNAT superfamily N-acetyltransferase